MKLSRLSAVSLLLALIAGRAVAQPSFEAPPPSREVVEDPAERRAQYLARIDEVLEWRSGRVNLDDPATGDRRRWTWRRSRSNSRGTRTSRRVRNASSSC
ncbi:MAG: hypothetical protein ACREIA_16845 [Opitutaceae bacterium]